MKCYKKNPLKIIKGIPVFAESDEYTQNYEKISSDHVEEMKKTGKNPFMKEELWKELENDTKNMILEYSSRGKILDAGVGLGRLLSMLPNTYEKYGLDISLNYLPLAKKKGIEVCYARLEDIPYKDNFFDVIVCTDVLEHVLDLNLVCQQLLSVLKKNGLLIVRVPYKENLVYYLGPKYPYKYVHLRNFDENSLKLLFEKVFGCKTLDIKTTGNLVIEDVKQYCYSAKIRNSFCEIFSFTKWIHSSIYEALFNFINRTEPTIIKNIDIIFVAKKL